MIRCGEPQIGEKERAYVLEAIDSGQVTEGAWVSVLARRLGERIGGDCIPLSSGTAALHAAYLAVGVGPGDEVVVPATTYVATANAAIFCGATVRIVDVDRDTWTMCPKSLSLALTPATALVVPVHLYGVSPDMDAIHLLLAARYRTEGRRISVIEDCSETMRGPHPLSDAATYSFYGSKMITTGGEGGAIVTEDPLVCVRARHISHQSMTSRRYEHDCLGFNYRMTEMQAAFGVAQLERLDEFLKKRADVFGWYDRSLGSIRQKGEGYWAYAVRTQQSASVVAERMLDAGIETRPVFPPLWRFPHIDYRPEQERVAELIHRHGLVLPTHCGLTEDDVDKVCREFKGANR